jgi:hypothetical protein
MELSVYWGGVPPLSPRIYSMFHDTRQNTTSWIGCQSIVSLREVIGVKGNWHTNVLQRPGRSSSYTLDNSPSIPAESWVLVKCGLVSSEWEVFLRIGGYMKVVGDLRSHQAISQLAPLRLQPLVGRVYHVTSLDFLALAASKVIVAQITYLITCSFWHGPLLKLHIPTNNN